MATLWIAFGTIFAAFVIRGVKISEFRQAWINELRSDIAEYTSKTHEWMDLYLDFNRENSQITKAEIEPKLNRIKYDALHILDRITLRFSPEDTDADIVLEKLVDLLDPSRLDSKNQYTSWRKLSDEAISKARALLKEEWEDTKNPLRKKYRSFKSIIFTK
ncbi:MAG: hypothetical protein RPS47_07745 [Colwellia sp.]